MLLVTSPPNRNLYHQLRLYSSQSGLADVMATRFLCRWLLLAERIEELALRILKLKELRILTAKGCARR